MMALTKTLKRNDFDAQMLPFDVYQGPYIFVNGVGAKVWHHEVGGRWLVEMGRRGNNAWRTCPKCGYCWRSKAKYPKCPKCRTEIPVSGPQWR